MSKKPNPVLPKGTNKYLEFRSQLFCCHEHSHVSPHVLGTDQDRDPAFSYFHGKLLSLEALPKFPSALLLSQFDNTLCLPAKTREFQTRTSLHSITNIPTAYL